MMNPFPITYLALLAYAILRIFLGLFITYLGYQHLVVKRSELRTALVSRFPRIGSFFTVYLALGELVLGIMFTVGFYTQIAALAGAAYALKMLYFRKTLTHPLFPSPAFYFLMIGVCASLFITGAGVFAFDIPL